MRVCVCVWNAWHELLQGRGHRTSVFCFAFCEGREQVELSGKSPQRLVVLLGCPLPPRPSRCLRRGLRHHLHCCCSLGERGGGVTGQLSPDSGFSLAFCFWAGLAVYTPAARDQRLFCLPWDGRHFPPQCISSISSCFPVSEDPSQLLVSREMLSMAVELLTIMLFSLFLGAGEEEQEGRHCPCALLAIGRLGSAHEYSVQSPLISFQALFILLF